MNRSQPGQFYGKANETLFLNGVILNDSDYIHEFVDWHYHENAYFSFLLEGSSMDGNKKQVHECDAGSLLFQNWQDPHYNVGSKQHTRGFHVELMPSWFTSYDLPLNLVEGSIRIMDPSLKMMMYNVFKETKLYSSGNQLPIDALLVQLLGSFKPETRTWNSRPPAWVATVREALHAEPDQWTLTGLAQIANVHPVHLSRRFPKYFRASIGDYTRAIKVQKALSLLPDKNLSLTSISAECGFADQSHFIRCFKACHQLTPFQFRKLLLKRQAC